MENRIIELEKKIAFQEDMIEQLNQVVIEMQKKLAAVERELRNLREQQSNSSFIRKPEEETPPPHY